MNYLKTRRGRLILVCFVTCSVLLAAFPAIDLAVSHLFFHGHFLLQGTPLLRLLQIGLTCFLCASMLLVVALFFINRLTRRNICGVNAKKVGYLFLVLIVGCGLIVNVTFKDNFGRARPRDVAEFGGAKVFTPAFVLSHQCDKNCSFSSGDGAAAFFALALAAALSRKRRAYTAAVALGVFISLSRIAAGAHFFSDTVVSFFVMLIVADVLYFYMFLNQAEQGAGEAPVPATPRLEPARVTQPLQGP